MASSSNPPLDDSELIYLYASNANVSNFVSVKLSGKTNYHLWKAQMLCLMKTHGMHGIVEDGIENPRASSVKIKEQYDNLLKGWIFGSISDGVLGTVIDAGSAKDVWDKLTTTFSNSTMCVHQEDKDKDVISAEMETKGEDTVTISLVKPPTEDKDKDAISAELETKGEDTVTISIVKPPTEDKDKDAISAEMETKGEDTVTISIVNPPTEAETVTEKPTKETNQRNKRLLEAISKGCWWDLADILQEEQKDLTDIMRDAIDGDKNTMLHLAVGSSHEFLVEYLLHHIRMRQEKEVLEMKNVDGSTALHVAAIVGNKNAAKLLVQENKELLRIRDNAEKDPLDIAYSNMQFKTFMYLLKAANGCKTEEANSQDPDDRMNDDGETMQAQKIPQDLDAHLTELGVNVLVNLISAKEYS